MKKSYTLAHAMCDGMMLVLIGPIYLAMPAIMTVGIVAWVAYRAIRPAPPEKPCEVCGTVHGTCPCCSSCSPDCWLDEPPAEECT